MSNCKSPQNPLFDLFMLTKRHIRSDIGPVRVPHVPICAPSPLVQIRISRHWRLQLLQLVGSLCVGFPLVSWVSQHECPKQNRTHFLELAAKSPKAPNCAKCPLGCFGCPKQSEVQLREWRVFTGHKLLPSIHSLTSVAFARKLAKV